MIKHDLSKLALYQASQGGISSTLYVYKEKNWGNEIWIANNDKYCMKIIDVIPKRRCSIHYHRIKDETFHIMSGILKLELWDLLPDLEIDGIELVKEKQNKPDQLIVLWPGTSFRIPPRTPHRFEAIPNDFVGKKNSEKCQFVEVSTQHFEEDSYRIVPAPDYK